MDAFVILPSKFTTTVSVLSLPCSSSPHPLLFILYPSLLHTELTYKGGDADVLSVVDPHDRRYDLIYEALRHAQLQQRVGERPSGHVDEAAASQRVQEFLHGAEGVAVSLVLVDPGWQTQIADKFRKHFNTFVSFMSEMINNQCRTKTGGKMRVALNGKR